MSEAELQAIEARLLATRDKTLGPMENVEAIVGIADECVPVLIAEVRRLKKKYEKKEAHQWTPRCAVGTCLKCRGIRS